ncbi:MAG: chemotaxis protein CheX [Spirochaetales bacterium]|nr:chemotaxis protein CheX [Spirochaetales bacterium]
MKDSKLGKAVIFATKITFEDMVFVDAQPLNEDDLNLKPHYVLYVSYNKPESGKMALFLSSGCARMISENIFGIEWKDLGENDIRDCLLELLNVLAGNFLKLFYKHSEHYSTTFPKLISDISKIKAMEQYKTFYFDAEGKAFKICLSAREKEVLHG